MSAALTNDHTLDSCAAYQTGLTRSAIDTQPALKIAATVYPVNAGAVMADAFLQHVTDCAPQPLCLFYVKLVGMKKRVKSG
jgi:hypothetical protein